MPSKPKRSAPERVAAAQVAITNTLGDPEILERMTQRSYNESKLSEGQARVDAANARLQEMQQARGGKSGSFSASEDTWKTARQTYGPHIELARVALGGRKDLEQELGIADARERKLIPWIVQARQFYGNALESPEALVLLAPYGVDRTVLQGGLAQVEALAARHNQKARSRGQSEDATAQRRAAVEAVDAWMKPFRRVARVALKDRPQLLEKLGIFARS